MLKIYLICILILSHQLIEAQNPWAKSKGEAYLQLSYNGLNNYNQILTQDETNRQTERLMFDQTIQLYSEVGLAKKLSLIAFIPFKLIHARESVSQGIGITDKGKLNAFGNIALAVRKGFSFKQFEHSFQLQTDLPSKSNKLSSGLRSGFDAYTFSSYYSIGKSFSKKFYAFTYFGALIRTNGYSNQFRWGIEGGFKIENKLWTIFYIDHLDLIEVNDKQLEPQYEANGLYLDGQMYLSPGLKLIYEWKNNWYLNFGAGGALIANNVAATPALSVGFAKEW